MLMARFISSGTPYVYLLDVYTGATCGYSLFKLRSTYVGSCMRVRRFSDNAETDIGFLNDYLDTAAIISFAGLGGTAFVTKWYNQVSGGVDAFQATANLQPYIYDTGVITTVGSVNALHIPPGTGRYLNIGVQGSTSPNWGNNSLLTYVGIATTGNAGGGFISYNSGGTFNPEIRIGTGASGTTLNAYWNGGYGLLNATPGTELFAIHATNLNTPAGTTTISQYKNNSLMVSGSRATSGWVAGAPATFQIAAYSATGNFKAGDISEFILWNSDQSANRAAIVSNQNDRFNIY